jgi:hypothetical protein
MRLPQTGGCQCGKVRYAITEEPQSVYTCHCTACQLTAIGSRLSNSEVDWRAVNRRGKRRSTRLPRSLAKLWRAYYIPTRFGVGVRT